MTKQEYWAWKAAKALTVTRGNWCVSFGTGPFAATPYCRLAVFDSTSWAGINKGFTVRGKRDGEVMLEPEAEEHCLRMGYLRPYVPRTCSKPKLTKSGPPRRYLRGV